MSARAWKRRRNKWRPRAPRESRAAFARAFAQMLELRLEPWQWQERVLETLLPPVQIHRPVLVSTPRRGFDPYLSYLRVNAHSASSGSLLARFDPPVPLIMGDDKTSEDPMPFELISGGDRPETERKEGSQVFDQTAGIFLTRVAGTPGPTEYTLSDDGVFSFSPAICATEEKPGHELVITYDAVGPRVTRMGVKEKRRP